MGGPVKTVSCASVFVAFFKTGILGFSESSLKFDGSHHPPQHHAGAPSSNSQHPPTQPLVLRHGSRLRLPAGLHAVDAGHEDQLGIGKWPPDPCPSPSCTIWPAGGRYVPMKVSDIGMIAFIDWTSFQKFLKIEEFYLKYRSLYIICYFFKNLILFCYWWIKLDPS